MSFMSKFRISFPLWVLVLCPMLYVGCIEDTTTYPVLVGEITDIRTEGMRSASIDRGNRTVTLHLADTMALDNVRLIYLSVSDGSHILGGPYSVLDLSKPLILSIETYPEQIYEWKVSADHETHSDKPVTKYTQVPNMNFENWWKDGNVWNPYLKNDSVRCWDTANRAVTVLGGSSSTSPEEKHVIKGKACRMESSSMLGVFAAGNIYTGTFVRIQGLNGIIDQGWPFSGRPAKFHGFYDYKPAVVNKTREPYSAEKGKMDKGLIYACLYDWSGPHRANSGDKSTIINLDTDPSVIALARIELDDTGGEYREFSIDFEYRDSRTPTYLFICCSASRYADDFTGGVGSVLYVDELEFIY